MTVQSLRRDAHTLHNFAPTAVKYHNRSSPYLSGYPHSSPRPNTNLMKRPGRPSALKPVVSILLRSRAQRRNNRGVDRGQGFKMSFGADDTSAWSSSFYSRELGGSMILVLDMNTEFYTSARSGHRAWRDPKTTTRSRRRKTSEKAKVGQSLPMSKLPPPLAGSRAASTVYYFKLQKDRRFSPALWGGHPRQAFPTKVMRPRRQQL
jgi:hypothetical protein